MDSAQPVPPHGSHRPHHIGRDIEDDDVQGHVLPGGRTRPAAIDDDDVEGHLDRVVEGDDIKARRER